MPNRYREYESNRHREYDRHREYEYIEDDSEYNTEEANAIVSDAYDAEEELFMLDEEYSDEYEPCVNSNYYLGSYKYFPECGELLLISQISMRIFYASQYYSLRNYIFWYSGVSIDDTNAQIMQVFMKDDSATAVLKTHWIRLIQRTWRRVFEERQQYILRRKQMSQIQMQQFKPTNQKYPELRGMLSYLQKPIYKNT